MTRYQFLRFLWLGILSLVFYPLRALAGGEPPQASVTLDANSERRPGVPGHLKRSARFPSLSREPGLARVADMQPKASAPTGAVTPITPNSEFYVEDIHGPPKSLNAETWHLKIAGKVDRPLTLSLDQIRKRPTIRRIITLSCIGNPVGGYALGNAEWEGISLRDLLDEADPDFFTRTLIFKGADGYHDNIPLSRGRHRAALLAHTMNGEPLPREHGFPLRLLVPGLYGIKQVKWIREIEVSNETHTGYWEKRNWSRDGKVKIISRIDFPKKRILGARLENNYTGDRLRRRPGYPIRPGQHRRRTELVPRPTGKTVIPVQLGVLVLPHEIAPAWPLFHCRPRRRPIQRDPARWPA